MKVIISHDVDHITAWEHYKDLLIPKTIIRGFIELSLGRISLFEITHRLKRIMQNRWNNIEDLMTFNKENSIPSTFFIGVSRGNGLNYSLTDAKALIMKLINNGFDVGVHGIAYTNFTDIKKEHNTFQNITGLTKFGIRMHYLNCNEFTIDLIKAANYLFDCSVLKMVNPYKISNLWVFPLQVMDTHIMENNHRWQTRNLAQAKETTKKILLEAFEKKLNYFTVLFHDIYFSVNFKTWMEWYIWLVEHLKKNGLSFLSYNDAIKELERDNH